MAIDFSKPDLRIAYLVEGEYHDPARGALTQRVFWCGPIERTGSGLTTPDPAATIGRGENRGRINWQGRLTGAVVDSTLGNLKEHIHALSDVSFSVHLGDDGDEVRAGFETDLRTAVLNGNWANKAARMWLYDMDSGDFQMIARGRWDRNPTNIRPGRFSARMVLDILPPGQEWPMTLIKGILPEWTTDDSILGPAPTPGQYWFPDASTDGGYAIGNEHKGVRVGHVFGGSVAPGVWREVIPYGMADHGTFGQVFAHVSPSPNCWVADLQFEDNSGAIINVINDGPGDYSSGSSIVSTFENTDPTRGPLGTNVRFTVDDIDAAATTPGAFHIGIGGRVYAKIFGPDFALRPAGWNQVTSPWYGEIPGSLAPPSRSPDLEGPLRSDIGDVWEDIFTGDQFLGALDVIGTGAIAAFRAGIPSTLESFTDVHCAVPLKLGKSRLEVQRVIGDLARVIPCDIVMRFDPAVEDVRLYPIWRGPRPGQLADHRFSKADLSQSSVASLVMMDDPDGVYCTRLTFTPPLFFIAGITTAGAAASGAPPGGPNVVREGETVSQVVVNLQQESVPHFATSRSVEEEGRSWLRFKPEEPARTWVPISPTWSPNAGGGEHEGTELAAFYMAEQRQQKQKVIEATHGWPSYRVHMGQIIEYEIPGVWSDLGMVRGMRYDLDKQHVRIRSYHVTTLGRSGRDPDESKAGTHRKD